MGGPGPFPGGRSNAQEQETRSLRRVQETKVVAVADLRTNSVVVSAASGTMTQIAKMIESLDINPARNKRVFIYSLENANVDTVADILRGTFGSSTATQSTSNTSRTGTSQGGTSQSGSSQSGFGSTSNTSFGSTGGASQQR